MLPSKDTMQNTHLPHAVNLTRIKILAIINESTCFTIILDIWSSRNMQGYIGFEVVCVTKSFERYHLFLGVKQMIGRHTAANIMAEYEQMLFDWRIPPHLVILSICAAKWFVV